MMEQKGYLESDEDDPEYYHHQRGQPRDRFTPSKRRRRSTARGRSNSISFDRSETTIYDTAIPPTREIANTSSDQMIDTSNETVELDLSGQLDHEIQ